MTAPQFTLDWPYGWMTRDERNVVIYCTDAPGDRPIHGRIEAASLPSAWDANGKFLWPDKEQSPGDLINRPAPIVSVPADKLHDGKVYLFTVTGTYIATGPMDESQRHRPVKWFYADEVENVK